MTDASAAARIDELRRRGVARVRVTYADLHGYPRGKLIPLERLEAAADDGLAFCAANLTDDLWGNPVDTPGGYPSQGYPDMHARAELVTAAVLPWDGATAWAIAELLGGDGEALAASPRGAVSRLVGAYRERGLEPVLAPELEFYLCRQDADGRLTRYVERKSMVYTVDTLSDPAGVIGDVLGAAAALGLEPLGAAHEYSPSQYEVNLAHGPAVDACDRAFRFKAVVKELARRRDLLATFMGRPFNDEGGSGFHLHLSLAGADGRPRFAEDGPDGVAPLARRAIAGILAHAPALTALCAPTVNAYKRLVPGLLAPTRAVWGHDNRTLYVRVPAERGAAARIEFRGGDGSANPYIVAAAVLAAALDGIDRELDPPPPVGGDQSFAEEGPPLPRTLGQALDALEADERLVASVGPELVRDFVVVKRWELDRFRQHVTDWEIAEYAHHL